MEVIHDEYHGYDLHETRNQTAQNDVATCGKAWVCVCFHQFSSRELHTRTRMVYAKIP